MIPIPNSETASNESRSRSWVFTTNNYTDESYQEILKSLGTSTYYVIGKEVGESGTPHLQGFVHFKNALRFSAIKKKLPGSHIAIRKGTVSQAADYCKKDGDYVEFGDAPIDPKAKGLLEKERWTAILSNAKQGNLEAIAEEEPQVYLRMYSTLKRIAQDSIPVQERLPELTNLWITGPPGTGKSWFARTLAPEDNLYFKNLNKWWCGYKGEDVVIIEEWGLETGKFLGDFLKIWADIYSFRGEVKGGSKMIRPKQIVITSNYTIEECFQEAQLCGAITRRFEVKQMLVKYRPN